MNYFELFDIPVSLLPDKNLVRKRYMELSKQHHPDYFVNKTQDDQQNALEMSALLNKAFRTFSNTDATIAYVLEIKGLLEEEEKYALPPAFLMQMMEVNEELADAQMEGDPAMIAKVRQQLLELEKELYEPVKDIIEDYQEGVTSEEELLQVKAYYFKKKYLARLSQQLGRML